MNRDLKHIVQKMIDKGRTEEEIALKIKNFNTKESSKSDENNFVKRFLKSKLIITLLELVLPTILSILITFYNEQKSYSRDCDFDDFSTSFTFGFLFFFIVLMEWLRRYRTKKIKFTLENYLYIGVLFFVFLLNIWYANSICQ